MNNNNNIYIVHVKLDMVGIVYMTIVFSTIICVSPVHSQRLLDVTICEDDSTTIGCESGKVLNVVSALFGRRPFKRQCRYIFHLFTRCSASGTVEKVKEACENKQNCQLIATRRIYGDPCRFVKKYLEVEYRCVGKQTTISTPSNKRDSTSGSGNSVSMGASVNTTGTTNSKDVVIWAVIGSVLLVVLVVCVVLAIVRLKSPGYITKRLKVNRGIGHVYQPNVPISKEHDYDSLKAGKADQNIYVDSENIYISVY